jgi:hypothetical protein
LKAACFSGGKRKQILKYFLEVKTERLKNRKKLSSFSLAKMPKSNAPQF